MLKFIKTLALSAAALSLVVTIAPNRAGADDPYTEQVRDQLRQAAIAAGYAGIEPTHEPFIDNLGNGGNDTINIQLRSGIEYIIVGVCDEDCSDLDLELYDDNGNLVASDKADDDRPIVNVQPRWNAQFQIKVQMVSCSQGPCRYGIGVFGK